MSDAQVAENYTNNVGFGNQIGNQIPLGLNGIDPKLLDEQFKRQAALLAKSAEKTTAMILAAQKKELSEEEKRQKLLQEARDFRSKEIEDIEIVEYQEKLKKLDEKKKREEEVAKKQEALDKKEDEALKTDGSNIQPEQVNVNNQKNEGKDDLLSKLGAYISVLPKITQQTRKPAGVEQANIGEQVQRVSFHPEGIKILRTLLDPIYKALNAVTVEMDKGLKDIIEKMKDVFSVKSHKGIMLLLLTVLSEIVFVTGKLKGLFEFLTKTSTRLYTAFEEMFLRLLEGFKAYGKAFKRFLFDEPLNLLERMGLNVRRIASNAFEGITERLVNLKNGNSRALKLEELGKNISTFFNERILSPLNSVKNAVGDFFENRITKPIVNFIERVRNLGTTLETFFEPLIRPFKEFAKIFKSGESEGFFTRMVRSFGNIIEYSKNFVGPLQRLFNFLEPVLNLLKPFVTLIEGLAKLVSVEVISVIMGFVDAIRTFFDVWKDDKLSFLQKSVSIFAGFIGGIGSLISDTIKAISSIISFIPKTGWITKGLDSVAKAIDTHNLGKDTANAFRDYNSLSSAPDNKEVWKSGLKYQNASPEERKKMEVDHEKFEHKGEHFVPQGKDPKKGTWVADSPTPPAPVYQPEPQQPPKVAAQVDQSKMIDMQIKANQSLINSMSTFQKNLEQTIKQPVIINNNSQTSTSGEKKKDNAGIAAFDIITNARGGYYTSASRCVAFQ